MVAAGPYQMDFAVSDSAQTYSALAHELDSKTYYASDQNCHKYYLNTGRIAAKAGLGPASACRLNPDPA